MATEQAQRLIAMSLGKIAASRNQRGGANLHKSLLVSTVLHKARTTIMMENFQAMMQARRAQMMEAHQRFVDSERPATPAPFSGRPEAECPAPSPTCERVSCTAEDKENAPPTPTPCGEEKQMESTKEHNNNNVFTPVEKPSPLQSGTDNVMTSNCAKCVKRRSSEVSQDSSDDSQVQSPPNKRAKADANVETTQPPPALSSTPRYITSESSCQQLSSPTQTTCSEPLQAEAVQITNLVHRFNSGLSGLLSQAAAQAAVDASGHCAEQSFISCCTQVKDNMDNMSRPGIALTV